MRITTKSDRETKEFAGKMAEELTRGKTGKANKALVLALEGDLGSGKTIFSQGFLGYFGVKRAASPTFVIMKKYERARENSKLGQIAGGRNLEQAVYLYHIDCYRIRNFRDLSELGLEEIMNDPRNIVIIEWADRIKDILPDDAMWIKFGHKSENERSITV